MALQFSLDGPQSCKYEAELDDVSESLAGIRSFGVGMLQYAKDHVNAVGNKDIDLGFQKLEIVGLKLSLC